MTRPNRKRAFWSAYLLGGVSVLAGVLAWQSLAYPRVAHAQVPDSGKQRMIMIEELKKANKQLAETNQLLTKIHETQKAQAADDKTGK